MNYWTSTNYSHLTPETSELFRLLDSRIRGLDGSEVESRAKDYIAYGTPGMSHAFLRLRHRQERLIVRLGMPLAQITDPKNLCRNGKPSKWSVTHADADFDSFDRIEDIMALIRQALLYNLAGASV